MRKCYEKSKKGKVTRLTLQPIVTLFLTEEPAKADRPLNKKKTAFLHYFTTQKR